MRFYLSNQSYPELRAIESRWARHLIWWGAFRSAFRDWRMWVFFAVSTLGLLIASWAALKEPYYSAVMATTGLLYLAILTAFCTDVMARAAFAP